MSSFCSTAPASATSPSFVQQVCASSLQTQLPNSRHRLQSKYGSHSISLQCRPSPASSNFQLADCSLFSTRTPNRPSPKCKGSLSLSRSVRITPQQSSQPPAEANRCSVANQAAFSSHKSQPDSEQGLLAGSVSKMVWPGALHASDETVHRRYVQVKDKRCFCTDTGRGPVVVILSSQLVLSRSYRWTAEVLSKNFRVIVAEMPGCGKSDRVENPWSNSQYAEWISDFLAALKIDEAAALVGHSDSGGPALEATVRFPHQIKNLVLVDSIGANAPDSLPRLILMRMADAASEIRFSVPGIFHAGKNAVLHTRNWLNQIRVSSVLDLTTQAHLVKVPTLIAWGRRDKTIPLYAAGTFFKLIPNSHVYISDEGSHNWLIQRPEEFCQAVTEFVHRKDKTSTFSIQLASGVFEREKQSDGVAAAANGG